MLLKCTMASKVNLVISVIKLSVAMLAAVNDKSANRPGEVCGRAWLRYLRYICAGEGLNHL